MGCTQSQSRRHAVISGKPPELKGRTSQQEKLQNAKTSENNTIISENEVNLTQEITNSEESENHRRLTLIQKTERSDAEKNHVVDHRYYSKHVLPLGLGNGAKGEFDRHPQLPLNWAAVTRPGNDPAKGQKENQDSYLIQTKIGNDPENFAICVFDGHGPYGAFASTFVRDNLLNHWEPWGLGNVSTQNETEIGRILHNSCVEVNHELAMSSCDVYVSGSTAVMCIFKKDCVYVANVGDSRAVMGRTKSNESSIYEALDLSSDQKPDRPDEEARILKFGGRVFEWGVPRVWKKDVDLPGLAMSRSFGDLAAESVGVFAQPEVTRTVIEPEDRFIIIASDGIWEFITSQEAVEIVSKHFHKSSEKFVSEAAEELIRVSVERWNEVETVVDDCTCCIVKLNSIMEISMT